MQLGCRRCGSTHCSRQIGTPEQLSRSMAVQPRLCSYACYLVLPNVSGGRQLPRPRSCTQPRPDRSIPVRAAAVYAAQEGLTTAMLPIAARLGACPVDHSAFASNRAGCLYWLCHPGLVRPKFTFANLTPSLLPLIRSAWVGGYHTGRSFG